MRSMLALGCAFVCVLGAAPARAQDDTPSETAGRWLGGTNEAVQNFGKVGDYLGVVTAKSMVETTGGSAKRAGASGWNTTFQGWRGTTEATKKSLPYSVAPVASAASDVLISVVAPAIEGDGKGVISGSVNIGVSALVVTQGSAAGAQLFGAIGGAVGSFIPVVGTAAGVMVGGAIGSVTGGFVASIAYDRYGKSIVANLIEGGLSAITDPTPLQQAIAAREDFLRKQAAPELQAQWNYGVGVSEGFGQEETQLPKPLTGVYQPKVKPPGAPVEAFSFDSISRMEITSWVSPAYKIRIVCAVGAGRLTCNGGGDFTSGTVSGHQVVQQTGVVSGDTVHFTEHVRINYVHSDTGCHESYDIDSTSNHKFFADGRETFRSLGGTGHWASFQGKCGATNLLGKTIVNEEQFDGVGAWRKLQ